MRPRFDYFRRDCHHLNIPISFDSERLIMHARAIRDEHGTMTVAYAEKEVWNVYNLFQTRFNLHKRAYQHRVVHAIAEMLCDALLLADDAFFLRGRGGRPVRLSEAMDDLDAYSELSDTVFDLINYAAKTEPRLASAAALIARVDGRSSARLYAHVGEIVVPKDHERAAKRLGAAGLLEAILDHADPARLGDLKKHAYVDTFSVNYGMKDQNPVDRVRFYLRNDEQVGRRLTKDQVSCLVPQHFSEQYVRLYVREDDDGLVHCARQALERWELKAFEGRTESAIAPSPTKPTNASPLARCDSNHKRPRPKVPQPDLPRPPPK